MGRKNYKDIEDDEDDFAEPELDIPQNEYEIDFDQVI